MSKRLPVPLAWALALLLFVPSAVSADGCPDPANSSCTYTIVQGTNTASSCRSATPPIVRLCPLPGHSGMPPESHPFDSLMVSVSLRDVSGSPCVGALVHVAELSGIVNIPPGGATSSVSDVTGSASVLVHAAGGYGNIGVCADGAVLCRFEVRSPDVVFSALPTSCGELPTASTSFVNTSDVTNSACGFVAKFGPVTPGVNQWWDLNCSGSVNATDIFGSIQRGSVASHWGHGAILAQKTTCP